MSRITHPRRQGSMPRFLGRYVSWRASLSLECAIRKITSLTVSAKHLENRGLHQVWLLIARITIFDPETNHRPCRLHEAQPASAASTIKSWNGKSMRPREIDGRDPGRVLRGHGWQPSTN